MFCEKCGTEIPKGAKFCEKCGASVEPELQEPKEGISYKKWILGGIVGGIIIVAVVVVSLFATGILGGKDDVVQTSTDIRQDMGVSDATAQPTEQPTATPVITSSPTPEPTEVPEESDEPEELVTEKPKISEDEQPKLKKVNVEKEVKKIRKWYNETQNNLASYMSGSELEGSVYYYESGFPVKISIKGGYNNWNYSREYFYRNKKLYFAFVYDGKEEHRLYFKNGVMIRYIDENKKTYDYENKKLASFSEWNNKVRLESEEIYPDMLNCGN